MVMFIARCCSHIFNIGILVVLKRTSWFNRTACALFGSCDVVLVLPELKFCSVFMKVIRCQGFYLTDV